MLDKKLLCWFMIVQVLHHQANGTVMRIKREPSQLNALSKEIDVVTSHGALAKYASAKATNNESFQDENHDAELSEKVANNEASKLEVSPKAARETNMEINTKPPKAGNDLTLDAQVSPKTINDAVLNEEISLKTTKNKDKVEAIADDGFFHKSIDSDENPSTEPEAALRLEEEEKEIKQKGVGEKHGGEEVYVDKELSKGASKVKAAIDDGFFHQPIDSDENLFRKIEDVIRLEDEKETKQNGVVAKSGDETNSEAYIDESLLKAASNTEAITGEKQAGVSGKPDSEVNVGINVDKTLMKEQGNVKAETNDDFFHQPIDSNENLSIELEEIMRLEEEEKESKQKGVGERYGGKEEYADEALLKGAKKVETATDDGFFHQPIDSDENLTMKIEDAIRQEDEKEIKQNGIVEKTGGEANSEVYIDESLFKTASNTEAVEDDKQDGVGGKPGSEVNVSKSLMKARSNVNAVEYDDFFHQPFDSDENLSIELEEAIRMEEEAKEKYGNKEGAEVYVNKALLKGASKAKAVTDDGFFHQPIDSDENSFIDIEEAIRREEEEKEINLNSVGGNPVNSEIRYLDAHNHKVVPKNIFIIPETNTDIINLRIFSKPPNQAFMNQLKADMVKQDLDDVELHKHRAKKSFKNRNSISFDITDSVTLKKLLQDAEIYLKTEKGINYDYPCTIIKGNRFICKRKTALSVRASKRHRNFKEHSQNPKKNYWKPQGYDVQDSLTRLRSDYHKHANGPKAYPIVKNHGYQHEKRMKMKYY